MTVTQTPTRSELTASKYRVGQEMHTILSEIGPNSGNELRVDGIMAMMIVYNYDADLEVSDTCVRSSLLS